jgi:AcrR family transcriptional regulator
MSKGAFYHYFPSKQALLEALIDSIIIEIEPILLSIVQDGSLPALEKLEQFFRTASQWKIERKDFMLGLLHAWYSDENAIVRQKMQAMSIQWYAPMLVSIIQQGIHEGVLHCAYPDMAGEVSLHLLMGMGDTISDILLSKEAAGVEKTRLQHTLEVYIDAMERVLGAPVGSIKIIDPTILEQWVVLPT